MAASSRSRGPISAARSTNSWLCGRNFAYAACGSPRADVSVTRPPSRTRRLAIIHAGSSATPSGAENSKTPAYCSGAAAPAPPAGGLAPGAAGAVVPAVLRRSLPTRKSSGKGSLRREISLSADAGSTILSPASSARWPAAAAERASKCPSNVPLPEPKPGYRRDAIAGRGAPPQSRSPTAA